MAWTDKDFVNGAKLTAAEMDQLMANFVAVGRSAIAGLVISSDADSDHDILIAIGIAIDNANGAVLELTTAITKRIDAGWAAGDDAGGLFTGAVANTTWYHLFLIKKDSDNSIDAGFDTSVTAANIPTGYTAFRRLGSVLTNGSANIIGFTATETDGGGLTVEWKVTLDDVVDYDAATTRQTPVLSVPTGIVVLARMRIEGQFISTAALQAWVRSTSYTDAPADGTNQDVVAQTSVGIQMLWKEVETDTLGQIAHRSTHGVGEGNFSIATQGYIDFRR